MPTEKLHKRRRKPRHAPGVGQTRRFVPRFHYELLVCGAAGHKIVGLAGPAAPAAVDGLVIRDMHGMRWHRCLRCDSWLPIELLEERRGAVAGAPMRERKPLDRDAIKLPLRGRPLRDRVILRIIAIDRGLHVLVLGVLAVLVLSFSAHQQQLQHRFNQVANALQPGTSEGAVHSHGLLHTVDQALHLNSGVLHLVGGLLGFYAFLEAAEAVGLWMHKLWAEYLTLIATALFLPYEIYELSKHLTIIKLIAFGLNAAIVIYLLFAKRLFGLRGGLAAIEREYAKDMGWQALEEATPTLVGDVNIDAVPEPDSATSSA
ncbi:MAG: DUF2127 domain-containing protein [Thermoleophilia bacterium]|nr:DUF2127 domain-containing protein [Thermoleophilia bacterium]